MAVYEYECSNCKRIMEAFQKITDAPMEKCIFCGGGLKKLISNNTFILKGEGWFKNNSK